MCSSSKYTRNQSGLSASVVGHSVSSALDNFIRVAVSFRMHVYNDHLTSHRGKGRGTNMLCLHLVPKSLPDSQ